MNNQIPYFITATYHSFLNPVRVFLINGTLRIMVVFRDGQNGAGK